MQQYVDMLADREEILTTPRLSSVPSLMCGDDVQTRGQLKWTLLVDTSPQ